MKRKLIKEKLKMLNQDQLHERILYPVTRVRAEKAGGSGVLVYSQPDPKNDGEYINIALTCEHVISDCVKIKEEWDAVIKKDVKKDFMEECSIEVFDYNGSKISSANSTQATVIAYDKNHDLSAVKLHNTKSMPYVAKIIPKDTIEELRLFDPVWVSGCSLLHDPFASNGSLTYLREIIEQKEYMMYNAPSIFGNSGGGVFNGNTGDLLGLASRISTIQLGFGIDVMTWMGFCTHPERIHQFIEHQELQFLIDPEDDYYSAMKRRNARRKDGLRQLFFKDQGDETQVDPKEYEVTEKVF